MNEVKAQARYVGMSAQKVRRVVDLVRGQPADAALTLLKFTPNAAARPVAKTLRAAIGLPAIPRRIECFDISTRGARRWRRWSSARTAG